jgi:hypothetical protein
MLQIKITKILLNPIIKSEETIEIDDKLELDETLIEILENEITETEDVKTLIKKFNLGVRRFNKGLTDSIVLYTHPSHGVILRVMIDIYEKIGKEIGKLV